jgi:hypothetical protein
MARRSKISIASRRLKTEAVESVASVPKFSTKPGRTSAFFGPLESADVAPSSVSVSVISLPICIFEFEE